MNARERLLALFDRKRRLYRRAYATPDGKAVIDDILTRCRYGKPSQAFNDKTGGLDPLALAVAEGHREIAAHIVKHLSVSDFEMQLRLKDAQNQGDTNNEY